MLNKEIIFKKKLYLSDYTHTNSSKIKIVSLHEVEEAHEVPVIIKLLENLDISYKIKDIGKVFNLNKKIRNDF